MRWLTWPTRMFESWSARFLLAMLLSIPGMIFIERGQAVIGTVLIFAAWAAAAALSFAAPGRRLTRLERRARSGTPADDGDVVLVGRVVSAGEPMIAPYSKSTSVACWHRSLMDSDAGWATDEEVSRAVDFVMQCGETLIAVEASRATILFDPARATWTHEESRRWRYEEASAGIGDLVLVAGRLVRGPDDGPFRASARITAGKRPVVIGLFARPGDRGAP